MNAIPNQTSSQVDWVINYVEVNSQPSSADSFSRLRITDNEIQIDPAGIVLTIQQTTDQGIELRNGPDIYFGTFAQRGNELVVKLDRSDDSGNVMIVAKRCVSEFDPSIPFSRTSFLEIPEPSAIPSKNDATSFF